MQNSNESKKDWLSHFEKACETPAEQLFLRTFISQHRLKPVHSRLSSPSLHLVMPFKLGEHRFAFLVNHWLIVEIDEENISPLQAENSAKRDQICQSYGYSLLHIPAKLVFAKPKNAVWLVRRALVQRALQVEGRAENAVQDNINITSQTLKADKINFQRSIALRNRALSPMIRLSKRGGAQWFAISKEADELLKDLRKLALNEKSNFSTLIDLAQSKAVFNQQLKKFGLDEQEAIKKNLNEPEIDKQVKQQLVDIYWQSWPSAPISQDIRVQRKIDNQVEQWARERQEFFNIIKKQCIEDIEFEQVLIDYLIISGCNYIHAVAMVDYNAYFAKRFGEKK